MRMSVFLRREMQGILWDILLAVFFGGVIFTALVITTGGVLVSLATALASMFVFGLFHYLVWGQGMLKHITPEKRREEVRAPLAGGPKDEFTLVFNERERRALIDALEQSLAKAPMDTQREEAVREVLARLRGFGV